jgi:exodeoxyribonuclease V alpha subunit
MDVVEMTKQLYINIIKKYKQTDDIQILIPMRIGELGTIRINEIIQEAVNPFSPHKGQITIKDSVFRQGDKVIHTINNYEIEVFNGDIGKVIEISGGEKMEMTVKFSDSREIIYAKSDIFELDLAYAISIHKSQGSEFDCVILPLMKAHYRMLYKQLIYTGLTRAKKFAVFVGERDALKIAVGNSNANTRQTSLRHMLMDEAMEMPI